MIEEKERRENLVFKVHVTVLVSKYIGFLVLKRKEFMVGSVVPD